MAVEPHSYTAHPVVHLGGRAEYCNIPPRDNREAMRADVLICFSPPLSCHAHTLRSLFFYRRNQIFSRLSRNKNDRDRLFRYQSRARAKALRGIRHRATQRRTTQYHKHRNTMARPCCLLARQRETSLSNPDFTEYRNILLVTNIKRWRLQRSTTPNQKPTWGAPETCV